jgi:DNA-binding GntR family transcriptional regulator
LAPESFTSSGNGVRLRGDLTQLVARSLREAIFEGRLEPGSRIGQEAVARDLRVSRIPVREALRQLESEGLVSQRPNSGARVATLDFEECVEVYKIRERLEPLAFSESAGRLTEEQLATVVSLRDELATAWHDWDAWLKKDRLFHLAVYAGLPGKSLLAMIEGLWNRTQQYQRLLLSTFAEPDFEIVNSQHALIVHALQTKNIRVGEEITRSAIERHRLRFMRHRDLFHGESLPARGPLDPIGQSSPG